MRDEIKGIHTGDHPIQNPKEDRLSRTGFASYLAERIASYHATNSIVLSIYGDWGSGKSSIKNLALHHLNESHDNVVVVEFSPWLISGEESITKAFFSEIAQNLPGLGEKASRAQLWKKYANAFGFAKSVASAAEVAGSLIPGLSAAGKLSGDVLEKAQGLATEAADSLDPFTASLNSLKEQLRKSFSESEKKFLIVIDDIDRLTVDEICLVFRLVKSNADFPNFIYLLLFQRKTVEDALDKISNNRGRDYLEKIVHDGFSLPPIREIEIRNLLFSGIDRVFGKSLNLSEEEKERFINIWTWGLKAYFRNLRDVYRFLSTLDFHLSFFISEECLDVNPTDLIVLECVRVFEPEVYQEISTNDSLLIHLSRDADQEKNAFLEQIRRVARNADADKLINILHRLFPTLETVVCNMGYSNESLRQWEIQRRVCTEKFFTRYFNFKLEEDEVPESVIEGLLQHKQDRDYLSKRLEELRSQGKILYVLGRLESEENLDNQKDPTAYLLGLSDITDRLHESERVGLLDWDAWRYPETAVYRALERMDSDSAKELVMTLIRETNSLFLACRWIDELDSECEGRKKDWPTASPEELATIREVWVGKIKEVARDRPDELPFIVRCDALMMRWRTWGNVSDIQDWIASIKDPNALFKLVEQFISQSSAQTFGSAYVKDLSYISWKARLSKIGDKDIWQSVLERINQQESKSPEQERSLKLLKESMDRWEKNVEDDNPDKFQI